MNNKLVFEENNNIYELIDKKDEQLKEEMKDAIKYFFENLFNFETNNKNVSL